ncbi:MAG: sugar nucleotide-binding protein [Akkermansiaceae bacterium]|nr:sugar nucleotide-binding protein [Akkermansiaceae bacterium]
MTIILGGSGYIGRAIRRHFSAVGEPFRVVSRSEINYYDRDALLAAIRGMQAKFLVNAAGYTGKPNVDACEVDKANCLEGNAVLPGIIREACEAADLPWGHVSSGCIYSGRRPDGGGFTEDDPPNFSFRAGHCSFYSGTKALGEEILEGARNCYLWRLRIPFNHLDNPRNYLTKLLRYDRLLDAENSITHLDELARVCHECMTKDVPPGIYNVTNPGSITTREVVELIREHLAPEKEFRFFESEEEFMKLAAVTPRSNCVLDTRKLQAAGIEMTPVREAIVQALRDWKPEEVEAG